MAGGFTKDEWGNTYDASGAKVQDAKVYDEEAPVGFFSKLLLQKNFDTPNQRRANTPWTHAWANTVRAFLPYTNTRESVIPDAVYGLRAPIDATGKAVRGEPVTEREQAEAMMGVVGFGGIGKAMAAGGHTPAGHMTPLGYMGKKLGMSDPYLQPEPPPTPPAQPHDATNGRALYANGDEKGAFLLGNNQTPFYGDSVGPKGRIANPTAEARRLQLTSGLADAPTQGGFFNPATSALLQSGVAPKQTLTYYQKQMGARGGKLPPGAWEKATDGIAPDQTIARDDLVRRLDAVAPQMKNTAFLDEDLAAEYGQDPARFKDFANRGPFENYRETVVGYPNASKTSVHPTVADKYVDERSSQMGAFDEALAKTQEARRAMSPDFAGAMSKQQGIQAEIGALAERMRKESNALSQPGAFTDSHFDVPNMEGWYRTQDANQKLGGFEQQEAALRERFMAREYNDPAKAQAYNRDLDALRQARDKVTRLIEEVQPQRYQKMRDLGEGVPQEQLNEWSRRRDMAKTNTHYIRNDLRPIWDKYQHKLDSHQRGYVSAEDQVTELRKVASPEDIEKINGLITEYRDHYNTINDLDSKIMAGKKGVNPSPYTHDVNASTDILLKNILRDATKDGVDRLSWTPGEAQAERYNQALRDIKGLRYDPQSKDLYVMRSGERQYQRIAPNVSREKLPDYVGDDVAKRLLATEAKPSMPGANYTGHMLEFPEGMTLGGDGMKAYYGSGKFGDGGILTSRIKSILRKITGREPDVKPNAFETSNRGSVTGQYGVSTVHRREQFPSVELSPEARAKIKKTGLSLFSNGDEKAAFGLTLGPDGQYTAFADQPLSPRDPRAAFSSSIEAPPGRKLDPNGFYSVMDEALQATPMKKGNGQQWLNALKKGGTKDQEIYWRGLDDFLKTRGPAGAFTKEEVLAYAEQNKVKVKDFEHTKDGETPDSLRERELENVWERVSGNSPEDYGYYIVKSEDPDGGYEVRAGSEDGELIVGGYTTEKSAVREAMERAAESEAESIRNMSDDEIMSYTDSARGENTSNYIKEDAPGGNVGDDYRERVLALDPKTLERKGSGGWTDKTGLSRDDVHPDSFYDHGLGWRLEGEFNDLADSSKKGLLTHEMQSRWHARGEERGWKKAEDPIEEKRLKDDLADKTQAYNALNDERYFKHGDEIYQLDTRPEVLNGLLPRRVVANYTRDLADYKGINSDLQRAEDSLNALKWHKEPPLGLTLEQLEERARAYLHPGHSLDDIWSVNDTKKQLRDAGREADAAALSRLYFETWRMSGGFHGRDIDGEIANKEHTVKTLKSDVAEMRRSLDNDYPFIKKLGPLQDENVQPWQDAYSTWSHSRDQARLAANEAESRVRSLEKGAQPGPFVADDKSSIMGLLLKSGLYDAATRNMDFYGVQGPKRQDSRWPSGPTEDYRSVIPNVLKKLLRMHDKNAKVEPIYPGKRASVTGTYNEMGIGYTDDAPLPLRNEDGRYPRLTEHGNHSMHISSRMPVRAVELVKDENGNAAYALRLSSDNERVPKYTQYVGRGGGESYFHNYDNTTINAQLFKSKDAAEAAMRAINKDMLEKRRQMSDPQAAFEEIDSIGEPYTGAYLTPEMRESIKKRGFPMFVNGDEKAAFAADDEENK